ncbi:MAG: hypothetical protein HYV27_10485 [Candidatus Hydrogenedentes bacterium]|nr:hypothetical protein [Candidatus Hydrogenedentota bacterium]
METMPPAAPSEQKLPPSPDRIEQILSFVKFFLGTFVIGLLGVLTKNGIEEHALNIKEQENVGEFVRYALDKSAANRKLFAQYFATVSTDEQTRERWNKYLTIAQLEIADYEALVKEKETALTALNVEILRSRQELAGSKAQLDDLEKEISTEANENEELLKKLGELTSQVHDNRVSLEKNVSTATQLQAEKESAERELMVIPLGDFASAAIPGQGGAAPTVSKAQTPTFRRRPTEASLFISAFSCVSMYASEHAGGYYPPLNRKTGVFMIDPAQTIPLYADAQLVENLADRFYYLGYVIQTPEQGLEFLSHYESLLSQNFSFESDLNVPVGKGNMSGDTLFRLSDEVLTKLVADPTSIEEVVSMRATIPILFPKPHVGRNALFMDGHVGFLVGWDAFLTELARIEQIYAVGQATS